MTSLLRRLSDGFLRLVTPCRAELTRGPTWLLDGFVWREQRALVSTGHGIEADEARRLGYWPGQERRPDFARAWREGIEDPLERPWEYRWDRLAKHSAGPGFSDADYTAARQRGRDVALATLGPALFEALEVQGYLDLPSQLFEGVTYRLRVGRRIQVLCQPGIEPPWYFDFLCVNPVYPLPEYEFFAQLYLYVRDQEAEVVKVAAPQPWDQDLGRTF